MRKGDMHQDDDDIMGVGGRPSDDVEGSAAMWGWVFLWTALVCCVVAAIIIF